MNELFKPTRRNFRRRKTVIKAFDDLWQADLADFQKYATVNKRFNYMLFVIDCFSKFLWIKPLKDKTAINVANAFENILEESRRNPDNLQTDDGKEFFNTTFSKLMKKHNINHYSTYSVKKAAIVERTIKTIKQKLFKKFSLRGNYKWVEILDGIVDEYNNTVHSTIKMKPSRVTAKTKLNAFNNIKILDKKRKFKIGDVVRISRYKTLFEKGYLPGWSTELFKIYKIQFTSPITYLLEDMHRQPIKGSFYTEEIAPAKYPDIYLVEKVLRKKGNKLYVKFLGLNEKSWVDAKDIFRK